MTNVTVLKPAIDDAEAVLTALEEAKQAGFSTVAIIGINDRDQFRMIASTDRLRDLLWLVKHAEYDVMECATGREDP